MKMANFSWIDKNQIKSFKIYVCWRCRIYSLRVEERGTATDEIITRYRVK